MKSDRIILEEYTIDKFKLGKNISCILRHNPKSLDLEMNKNGWVNVSELILALEEHKKLNFFDLLALSLNVDSKEFDKKFKELTENLKINVLDYRDENFVKLFIRLVEFDNYIKKVERYYELSDKKGFGNSLLNFLKSRYKKQQKFLPSALIGNLFGLRLGENGLELYRQYAFGRALMTEMPWLKVSEDGQAQGPHVMLLSGSSFAPNCLEYHINKDVNYILLSAEWKSEFLENAVFMELCITDRVSGDYTHREENLCKVIEQSMDTIIGELSNEGKILLIVNSYNDAEITLEKINGIIKRENYNFEVAKLSKTKDNDYDIGRMEISDFDSNNARVLIAPAESIARGFNIVDKNGHSSFSSVFFLTRPMQVPGDIKQMSGKLSGMMDAEFKNKKYENLLDKAEDIRNKSAIYWNKLEESLTKDLSNQDEILKKDIVASVFVLILQIYGRLARVENSFKITEVPIGEISNAMNGKTIKDFNDKVYSVSKNLEKVTVPTGAIIILPNDFDADIDPKKAIRTGFVDSNRLTQFVTPKKKDEKEKAFKSRMKVTVCDLFRQFGYTKPIINSSIKIRPKCLALNVLTGLEPKSDRPNKFNRAKYLPVYLTLDSETGKVFVECNELLVGKVPYHKALLEFSKISRNLDFVNRCKKSTYGSVKQKIISYKNLYRNEDAVLFVDANGNTRKDFLKFINTI